MLTSLGNVSLSACSQGHSVFTLGLIYNSLPSVSQLGTTHPQTRGDLKGQSEKIGWREPCLQRPQGAQAEITTYQYNVHHERAPDIGLSTWILFYLMVITEVL